MKAIAQFAVKWLSLAACVALLGCQPSLLDYETQVHVVRPGETLYTIAWRYGIDYRSLAQLNGIANPDVIFAGQRIRLRGSPVAGSTRTAQAGAVAPRPAATAPSRPAGAPTASLPDAPAPAWQWPTNGTLVSRFGSGDGIDSGIGIGGASGQPIIAAASGRVVYAGSGLIGYGLLVIIKHNDTYLSAYGHMEQVRVSEGDDVRQGQRIASMGIGPERRALLHFEIRRNGQPVDPLVMLPRS